MGSWIDVHGTPICFFQNGDPIWTPIYNTPYSSRVPLILGNPKPRNPKPKTEFEGLRIDAASEN